jgi:hypothetical protein
MVYADFMTLANRNYLFKAGIFLSLGAAGVIAAVSYIILPQYPSMISMAVERSTGIIQTFAAQLLSPAPYVPYISMAAAAVYALITMVLIYYFFEKTQTPEILFFALFVLSFAFEAVRVMVPLRIVHDFPDVYLMISSRILLFGRYFGVFSLFAASVYAAGLEMQKQGYVILIIAVAALVIVFRVPIDFTWDSSLSMINGYATMIRMVELGITLITMVSFFISAYSRGSREYIFIGIGSLLVFLGRNLLLRADTWVTPIPGLLLLVAGTWLICSQLHRAYLWL